MSSEKKKHYLTEILNLAYQHIRNNTAVQKFIISGVQINFNKLFSYYLPDVTNGTTGE